ncbi:MAG: hypothetical protein ACJAX4_004071 [Clostridium sp.]|jgi:hypothetical protein
MPLSVITTISCAFLIVESLCATTSVVLPLDKFSNDFWINISVALSSADVASITSASVAPGLPYNIFSFMVPVNKNTSC